jgi:TP901-1 family phage major tail protein
MAMNGTNLLILVNVGTEETPVYEAVGCQRDATIEESLEVIDVSCKDERQKRVLPGRSTGTISLDGLYVPDDAAYQALKSATRNGTNLLIAREENGEVTATVPAMITSLSESFPDQDAATISVGMEISGAWTEVGS